tara:strand:+ start:130 stop:360 length:231 start_codon:yes stop_codon:yes gene_type:complete
MKFNKKLTNRSEAKQFIKNLVLNDLEFHFDDDIKDIFKNQLSEIEIEDLEKRINEIFEILDNPYKYLVWFCRLQKK